MEAEFNRAFVVSDLHLGGVAGFQMFSAGIQFKKLCENIAALTNNDNPTLLLINGDFVDFLAEPDANYWNGTTATITWTTDEFTTYVLRYGTSSGVYTQQVSSDVFRKDQWATLTGLSPTETYYYQITSTDLSGNQAISPEYVLEGTFYVHLPFVTR